MKFDLVAYGDARPVSRICAKSPGHVSVILRQDYYSDQRRLDLIVYPTSGNWELVAMVGNERTILQTGRISDQGVTSERV